MNEISKELRIKRKEKKVRSQFRELKCNWRGWTTGKEQIYELIRDKPFRKWLESRDQSIRNVYPSIY